MEIKPISLREKDDDYIDNEVIQFDEESFCVPEKPRFKCVKCHKNFYLKKHLLLHIKGHSELRPYKCLNCNVSFKYKQNLLEHKLLHKENNIYKCHICGKGNHYLAFFSVCNLTIFIFRF